VVPLSVVAVPLLVLHLYYERVVLKRIGIREKEHTRRQIASDLHDDIASTLSSATIYLNVLKNSFKRPSQKQRELLLKIDDAIGSASEGMTDIVWTIAPKHDTLGDLITRIRILVTETVSAHNITAEFRIDEVEEQAAISELVRRNIYLIMKEGMNNIRKHANASLVSFSVLHEDRTLRFILSDNGRGLARNRTASKNAADTILHGNGIGNMQNRAKEIGAAFELRSASGGGTELEVSIEMMQLHH
jgi:two-component system sensor histidine kinase UhpB